MKLFKIFIIPFILAIIVFSPCKKISALSYESYNFDDSEINLFYDALLQNSSLPISEYNVYFGMYSSGQFITILLPSDDIQTGFKASTNVDCFFSPGSFYIPVLSRSQYTKLSTSSFSTAYNTNSFIGKYVLFYLPTTGILSYADCYLDSGKYWGNAQNIVSYAYISAETAPTYDHTGKTPLGIDVDGFLEWLELYPEFADIILNNTSGKLDLSSPWKMAWLLSYYDNFGMYSTDFYNKKDILSEIGVPDALSVNDMDILRNILKMQYNKYINSKTPPIVGPTYPPYTNNNPVTIPDDTLTQPIVIQNNNEFNYYYLREIVRLITNDINNDYSYHYENKNILNNIVSGINDINFNLNTNILPIVTGIANLDANLNLLVPVINSVNDNLTNLFTPITNMGDKLNDISLKLESGGSGNCNYDESFWELMLIPTFDEFDEIHAEFISKFPIVNEIATISLDGDIPTIENKLPDKELDNLIDGGLVPVARAGLPPGQNPYGFSYSESEITSSDLFTFTMPTGTNSWLDKFNGMEISFINFKKMNTAIQFFKGVISVLAVFAFTKWLLNFVPKLATGASTGDG